MTSEPTMPSDLDQVFRTSLRRHPQATALVIPEGRDRAQRLELTYAELDREVERLADLIAAECGARSASDERLIALFIPRDDPLLLASQLACWRLGLPWTFLDRKLPDARLAEIVNDGACPVVMAATSEHPRLGRALGGGVKLVDPTLSADPRPRAGDRGPRPESAAYVIYTSGSSGKPKGVVIEHHSIVNLVLSDIEEFGLDVTDRCAQGSSAAYDSYLEEVWLALAVGAAVVVLDDDTVRLGPDLPLVLRDEKITVFCPPPTLLRTMGLDDPQTELPDLRLLYVGGEALPPDVAAAWAPGRRLENGYGPTECTVTVMRTQIPATGPITIGRPLRGHRAQVLDDQLRALPPGEVGELCIAGPGLARGYLGRPDLTAERFPVHPDFGRIYRTGDLVRVDDEGRFIYLGRADAQVKVRGHRVELEEIEARLAAEAGVREAACGVHEGAIFACLVLEAAAMGGGGQPSFELEALRRSIAAQLPAVMCPAHYLICDELPRSTGGKIDRRRLPAPAPQVGAGRGAGTDASWSENPEVALVQRAFAESLKQDFPPPADADFFGDLGGHSLAAAIAVSALRRDPRGRSLTVRELYEHPRASDLAARLVAAEDPCEARVLPPRAGAARRCATSLIQGLALLLLALIGAAGGSLLLELGLPWLFEGRATFLALGLLLVLGLVTAPILSAVSLGLTLMAKRLLIGRFREGQVPAYGGYDLRRWLLGLLASGLPFGFLRGSGLDRWLLRALGAKVGRDVWFDRGVDLRGLAWDLVEIGDRAVVGRDATLATFALDQGQVVMGRVTIGADAVLETRAGMGRGSRLGTGARLGALSFLAEGAEVAPGQRADGVPAVPLVLPNPAETETETETETEFASEPASPGEEEEGAWSAIRFGAILLVSRTALGLLGSVPGLLYFLHLARRLGLDEASPGGESLFQFLFSPAGLGELVVAVVALGFWDLGMRLALIRLLAPASSMRGKPRRISRYSAAFLRRELRVDLLEGAGRLLSGTMFWPAWLRAAGMEIGARSEVSSIHECVPDEVALGADSFFADGVYFGSPRYEPGAVFVGSTRLGDENFVGNHAVIPAGSQIPDGVLLGIATPAPGRKQRGGDPDLPEAPLAAGTSWFGHPAIRLPRREIVEAERQLTHEPGWLRRLNRFTWEAARFLLPVPPLILGFFALAWLFRVQADGEVVDLVAHLVVAPLLFAAVSVALAGLTIALKWLLLGRMRRGQHGLWSCWCSRWDFLYVAWQVWAVPIMGRFEGTLWLVPWLRAFGVRIGRGVTLGRGFAQVVDPDMLRFENGATVAGLFQAHSFEDRVLKLAPVWIRRDASTEHGSVMMYGAELAEGARLRPHSVAMKHEELTANTDFIGIPSRVQARGD
jgi:non-ribosomal peptide synthetase-like protein